MKKRLFLNSVWILLTITFLLFSCSNSFHVENYESVSTWPKLEPDYSDLVIPPNMAPMNFIIKEEGKKYLVKIFADSNDIIRIESTSPVIQIPMKSWQNMLSQNKGKKIYYDIFVNRENDKWVKYKRIKNRIAKEPIDQYLVYRFLRPNYTVQEEMHIRQRDLQSYNDSIVMTTKTISACINCHSFRNNDPSNMLMHIRWGPASGTLFAQNGNIRKVDTSTKFTSSPGAYASWHPNGKLVAFSVNKVFQFFHATQESRDVIDLSSDLIIYNPETNTVSIDDKISSPLFMETYPNWTPDGTSLYFCRTAQLKENFNLENEYKSIKYDLMRLEYDSETKEWGELDTVVSAGETGLSCAQPRVSPDGKYVLFCMAEYGNFPIFRHSADLYLLRTETNEFHRIKANSNTPEGHHCWSSNNRWIVFTSKRDNGIYTRLYFSYIDEDGVAHKPFILPQKNPENYQTLFRAFSVPELIVKPVPFNAQRLIDVALDPAHSQKARLARGTKLPASPAIDTNKNATNYP